MQWQQRRAMMFGYFLIGYPVAALADTAGYSWWAGLGMTLCVVVGASIIAKTGAGRR